MRFSFTRGLTQSLSKRCCIHVQQICNILLTKHFFLTKLEGLVDSLIQAVPFTPKMLGMSLFQLLVLGATMQILVTLGHHNGSIHLFHVPVARKFGAWAKFFPQPSPCGG